jgi:hypothetical protein
MATLIVVEDLAGPSVRGRGGQALLVLQTIIGLERLGHRVVFLEYLDRADDPEAVASFTTLMARWWHPDQCALLDADGRVLAGMTDRALDATAADADAVITLAAHYRRAPWPRLERVRPRVLLEQDPGYTHLWAMGGDPRDVFGEHDVYFTVGANIGTARCNLPTFGIDWHPYVNPVVLDLWSSADCRGGRGFGTVAGLRDYGWLEYEGRTLGPKVEELRAFTSLPELIGESVDIVSELDAEDPDRVGFEARGWHFREPSEVAEPESFRAFVCSAAGEFSVAKGGYVGTSCGWFSDRSACFLAAGRPVILQATGFENVLPTGCGLFAVHDVDDAVAAVRAIRAEPARHAAAARRIAREFFDADRVLPRMLATAGVT